MPLPRIASAEDTAQETLQQRSQHSQPPLFRKAFLFFIALGFAFSMISIYVGTVQGSRLLPSSILHPCAAVDDRKAATAGIELWTLPPKDLMHSMTDEELLWRASFAPRMKGYPFQRVPKVAFLFLTRGPLPLAPLWEEFFRGNERLYSVYIHPLPSYVANFSSGSAFYRRQIPSKVAEWGEMSMCDAERRLLANALLDLSNERFVLLSESCIPLYNFSTIYRYLIESDHSFVGIIDDPGPYGRGRYNLNMAPEVGLAQWRKASQWFELSRDLAITIIKDTVYYPKFKTYCRPHCYVDEHYFPTMLFIEAAHLLANRSITWVDWSRGGAHPATFGKDDVTEQFLRRILDGRTCQYNAGNTTVCFLFGRKFSPGTLWPLLELAPTVFGFGH